MSVCLLALRWLLPLHELYHWVKLRLSQCANDMLYICHIVHKHRGLH